MSILKDPAFALGKDKPRTLPEDFERFFVDLPDVIRQRRPRRPFRTGIEALDLRTGGGLSAGESAIFGSGPGGLKTTVLVNGAEAMAGPETALCFIAWDESWSRVAAKTAARFGEPYGQLDRDHPEVIDSLIERLAIRDAFLRFVDPASSLPVEHILDGFARVAPPGRQLVYFVDLLQLMEPLGWDPRDPETAELRKIVEALLLGVRKQDAILYAASETTKQAMTLEQVQANPLGVFAGSRKIASRFDLPIAMAKLPGTPTTAKVFIRKSRLGPDGDFLLRLEPEYWRVYSLAESGPGENGNGGNENFEKLKGLAKHVLFAVEKHPDSTHNRLRNILKSENVRFTGTDFAPAVELLRSKELVGENPGPRRSLILRLADGVVAEKAAEDL